MSWWLITAVGTAALRQFFFRGKNAVWGGATGGAFVGVIIAAVHPGFNWETVWHSIVIGAVIGLAAEFLGMIGDSLKG